MIHAPAITARAQQAAAIENYRAISPANPLIVPDTGSTKTINRPNLSMPNHRAHPNLASAICERTTRQSKVRQQRRTPFPQGKGKRQGRAG
jgi:hypothetical protein